ncbi:small VCP/p97-interacting protein isoform X4 [Nilaparvata lugens]|uniref:small VCP/p97-interacting protein isoform X4 n=1 Tax=Nilaparvata lugens TaxID=108931 RepID=UPI000B987A4E|nr:small VCP/p97-interacting protein isoform X4 [Nilaparvata lugens]
MGVFLSCCRGNSVDFTTPDMETRRRQLAEAADKRQQEQENRGIKDPEKVKRMKQRSEEMERRQEEAARHGGSGSELKDIKNNIESP